LTLLLFAVLAGLTAGLVRAWVNKTSPGLVNLNHLWLVFLAFLIQAFLFFLPATRERLNKESFPLLFISSELLLLVFVWINRYQPGLWILGFGLVLNLLVITMNGGWMPISPETVQIMAPEAPLEAWIVGERLGTGKDMILLREETRLWWLEDQFVPPNWFPYRAAFSPGDIFIALGAFWVLWSVGDKKPK
jgi:hypothetical protein